MKFSSKTLWKAMFLSSLSLPVFAAIEDPGIAYCMDLGGCGTNSITNSIFKQIAESIFDTCNKEPNKDGCQQFNQKLNTALNNEVSKCIDNNPANKTIFDSSSCIEIRNKINTKYLWKDGNDNQVKKCIDDGYLDGVDCKTTVTNKVQGCINSKDDNDKYCVGIKNTITATYTLTKDCNNTTNNNTSSCKDTDVFQKVEECIVNNNSNPNHPQYNQIVFNSDKCIYLRDNLIDHYYLSKTPAHSYFVISDQAGDDALYLGTFNPTSSQNKGTTTPTYKLVGTQGKGELNDFKNSPDNKREDKEQRLVFEWVYPVEYDAITKEMRNPKNGCGVVIGLKEHSQANLNVKRDQIVCKADYDAIKSCPDNKKLKCEP